MLESRDPSGYITDEIIDKSDVSEFGDDKYDLVYNGVYSTDLECADVNINLNVTFDFENSEMVTSVYVFLDTDDVTGEFCDELVTIVDGNMFHNSYVIICMT